MAIGQKRWQQFLVWRHQHPHLAWAIGAGVGFWLICCVISLQRYYNFYPTFVAFDQGIFNQVFWNNLHGRWFESSLSSTESIQVAQGDVPEVFYRRLGQHFTPALLLWLPFYALFPSPAGLSVLQITLLTGAGGVLYILARQYHPPRLSAWITVSYYGAIAVISPAVANFHDISQVVLYTFGLFLALEKRWWKLFALLVILILIAREDSGIVLFSVGLYLLLSWRFPKLGLGLCGVSLGYMLLLTNWLMPLFSADISQRFMIEEFGHFVDGEEASTLEVIWGILSRPRQVIASIFTPLDPTLRYLLGHWVPLAFVPVLSPSAWILAACPLLKLLLRQEHITALSLHLRYALTLVPGLFYGTILWWSHHPQRFQRNFRRFWAICIGLSLFFTVTANPNRSLSFLIPDSFQPWVYVSPVRQWQHSQAIRSLLAQIPPQASVTATDHIVAHVSNRREVLRFPRLELRNDDRQVVPVEYAIADLWYLQQHEVAFPDYRRSLTLAIDQVGALLRLRYGLMGFEDGVVLLQAQRRSDSRTLAAWLRYERELRQQLRERASTQQEATLGQP